MKKKRKMEEESKKKGRNLVQGKKVRTSVPIDPKGSCKKQKEEKGESRKRNVPKRISKAGEDEAKKTLHKKDCPPQGRLELKRASQHKRRERGLKGFFIPQG